MLGILGLQWAESEFTKWLIQSRKIKPAEITANRAGSVAAEGRTCHFISELPMS